MAGWRSHRGTADFAVHRVVALLLTVGLAIATARLFGPEGRGQFVLALLTATGLGEVAAGGHWLAARYRALGATDGQWRGAVDRSVRLAVLLMLPAGTALAIGYHSMALGLATALALCATTAAAVCRGRAIAHEDLRAYGRSLPLPALCALGTVVVLGAFGLHSVSLTLVGWSGGLLLARRHLLRGRPVGVSTVNEAVGNPGDMEPAVSRCAHLGLGVSSLLLSFLGYRVDYYALQLFGSTAELGLYSVGVALAELILLPHSVLVTIHASRTASSSGRGGTSPLWPFLVIDVTTVAVLGAVAAAAGPYALHLFFGDSYAAAGSVVPYLVPGLVASCAIAILTTHLNVTAGSYGASIAASLVNASVTFVAVAILVPGHGIVGAATGSSSGYVAGLAVAAAALYRTGRLSGRTRQGEHRVLEARRG